MSYRPYAPPAPLLIGYDPFSDLAPDHLARLVEAVVEEAITVPLDPPGPGQPPFDPRLPLKVLVYGYATGTRSSRRLEQLCTESLPYLYLTRGDRPGYRTLCRTRVTQSELIEQVWISLFTVAAARGLQRLGHLVVDSTKLRADASPEAVIKAEEYAALRAELTAILAEAEQVDAREEQEGPRGTTRLGAVVEREEMREIVRRVRKQLAQAKQAEKGAAVAPPAGERGSTPPTAGEGAAAGSPTDGPRGEAGVRAAPPEAPAARAASPAPAGSPAPAAAPRPPLTRRMRQRVKAGLTAVETALAEQRKHLCLTDPDARMMGEGRSRQVRECYSFAVAVDREARLLVAGQVTQEASDNTRLEPLVEAAKAHEPAGVKAVDGDSGFYQGGPLGRLIQAGIDLCVPDSATAGDLHRGQPVGTVQARTRGRVEFVYDPEADCYRCPEGNVLRRGKRRVTAGQKLVSYAAERSCRGCPRESECLLYPQAQYRTVTVGEYQPELDAARQRFDEPAHRERYRHRGEVVETVFGFVRGTLGYTRWLLRGVERVGCEARLVKLAYQLRKVQASGARG